MILDARGRPVTTREPAQRSVRDLLRDIADADGKMSAKNSHRGLLRECALALVDLSKQLQAAQKGSLRGEA